MSRHLTEGELRAALDGELEAARLRHIETCAACQKRRLELEARSLETRRRMELLRPANEAGPTPRQAWARFSQRILQQKEYPMTNRWFSRPLVRFGAAALLVLVLVLVYPPTRALTGQILNLFRVQAVEVVPVDFTGLEQLTGDGALGNKFTELISSSVEMEKEPDDPVTAASAEEASQLAGFNVRIPAGMTPSQINVTGDAAFRITMDRDKAQALLNEAGRSDLVLPGSVDGAEISVEIPATASVAFGTCPRPGQGGAGNTEQSTTERRYPDCVIFAQIPSPSVNAPAGLDIEALARIALEFTGMSREEAEQLTSTVNWTSTLLVPIPRNATTYEQVSVDGVTGTLIQNAYGEASEYALLWVKDEIIYAISGLGDNVQQALDMANSLP